MSSYTVSVEVIIDSAHDAEDAAVQVARALPALRAVPLPRGVRVGGLLGGGDPDNIYQRS